MEKNITWPGLPNVQAPVTLAHSGPALAPDPSFRNSTSMGDADADSLVGSVVVGGDYKFLGRAEGGSSARSFLCIISALCAQNERTNLFRRMDGEKIPTVEGDRRWRGFACG